MSFNSSPYFEQHLGELAVADAFTTAMANITAAGRYKVTVFGRGDNAARVGASGQRHTVSVRYTDAGGVITLDTSVTHTSSEQDANNIVEYAFEGEFTIAAAAMTVGVQALWTGVTGQQYQFDLRVERIA